MASTKSTTRKKPAARPTARKDASSAKPVTAPSAEPKTTTILRRKELVARIVATTGMKPNQVKTALDGVLGEIGKALAAGEGLNVPALGKLTVNRRKSVDGRDIVICKLRRKSQEAPASENDEKPPLEPAAQ